MLDEYENQYIIKVFKEKSAVGHILSLPDKHESTTKLVPSELNKRG